MASKVLAQKLMDLLIERDEVLGNLASHHLDLSEHFEQVQAGYRKDIRELTDKAKEMVDAKNAGETVRTHGKPGAPG